MADTKKNSGTKTAASKQKSGTKSSKEAKKNTSRGKQTRANASSSTVSRAAKQRKSEKHCSQFLHRFSLLSVQFPK